MTLGPFLAIFIRLYGLYLTLAVIFMLPQAAEGISFLGKKPAGYFPFVQCCALLIPAVVFLFSSKRLSKLLSGKLWSSQLTLEHPFTNAFLVLGLLVAGLFIIQHNLPSLFKACFAWLHGFSVSDEIRTKTLQQLVFILFSVTLMVASSRLVSSIKK